MDDTLRILLLEDCELDAELIEHQLLASGLQFVTRRVESREGFEKALTEFKPAIVLADYTLPQFTALDALQIMARRKTAIPFVLVTGNTSEEIAVECMREGADDYILKAS